MPEHLVQRLRHEYDNHRRTVGSGEVDDSADDPVARNERRIDDSVLLQIQTRLDTPRRSA